MRRKPGIGPPEGAVQNDETTKRKPGRPRRNSWLALPIGFHSQPPYSLLFRGENGRLLEWFYIRCVQLSAVYEPIGRLSCSGIVPNTEDRVAEIFELPVSFIEDAFKSFLHWNLLSITEGREGREFYFRDAEEWTAGLKSTGRVQAHRTRATEED